MMSPFPLMVRYLGVKEPSSTLTPSVDFGRSRTWPTDAFTTKRAGKNFLMVLAFVGDSTMISGFATAPPVLVNAFSILSDVKPRITLRQFGTRPQPRPGPLRRRQIDRRTTSRRC